MLASTMKKLCATISIALLALVCLAGDLTIKTEQSVIRTGISSFPEDHLDLVLRDGNRVLDRTYLYSSYGMAEVQLIGDAKGNQYALVRHGRGRGTHVREEFVSIFKVGRRLTETATFPIGGPAGMKADWEYRYRIDRPKTGGLKFILSLRVTGKDASIYPEDKERTIVLE
jgi:hypothetical protein